MRKFLNIHILIRFFIALIISGACLWLALKYIPSNKLHLEKQSIISENGKLYFSDIDMDGKDDMLHYFYYERIEKSCVHIFNNNFDFVGMIDIPENPINDFNLLTGDINGDKQNDIILFTQKNDSLILNIFYPKKSNLVSLGRYPLLKLNNKDNAIPLGLIIDNKLSNSLILFMIVSLTEYSST